MDRLPLGSEQSWLSFLKTMIGDSNTFDNSLKAKAKEHPLAYSSLLNAALGRHKMECVMENQRQQIQAQVQNQAQMFVQDDISENKRTRSAANS